MIVKDPATGRYYDDETGEWIVPVDHSQNPLIGVALLVFVLWLAYQMSGAPVIVWVP